MNVKKIFFALLIGIACCGIPTLVKADTIYDNGTPIWGGYISDHIHGQQWADDFILSDTDGTVITDIHWWGSYEYDLVRDDNFIIQIFADTGTGPESSPSVLDLFVGNTASRSDPGIYDSNLDRDIYKYELFIAPLSLSAGVTYWLSITNGLYSEGGDSWGWAASTPFATSAGALSYYRWGSPWYSWELETAFYLTNDVIPEPTSLLLLGTGLGAMGLVAYRRKRK